MLKLELRDVKVQFGSKKVLTGINGSFLEQNMNFVIGVNGTGKSVLLKSIAGLLKYSGQINLTDGPKLYGNDVIAYVPQMAYSSSMLTAFEMVLLGKVQSLGMHVKTETIDAVSEIMKQLGISHLESQQFSSLSGGQKQLVIMAQALLSNPRVLLLDEPTSALDLYHQLKLLDITNSYCKKNHAMAIIVMHDLSLVARYCDEIMVLHQGKAIRQGKACDILESDLLEKVYQVEIDVSKSQKGYTTITPVRIVPDHK